MLSPAASRHARPVRPHLPDRIRPRHATDGRSQRIDALLVGGLLRRDAQTNFKPDLADSWEIPDRTDVVSVHRRALGDLPLAPTADYDFLSNLTARRQWL